jgi:hypothetical protein
MDSIFCEIEDKECIFQMFLYWLLCPCFVGLVRPSRFHKFKFWFPVEIDIHCKTRARVSEWSQEAPPLLFIEFNVEMSFGSLGFPTIQSDHQVVMVPNSDMYPRSGPRRPLCCCGCRAAQAAHPCLGSS